MEYCKVPTSAWYYHIVPPLHTPPPTCQAGAGGPLAPGTLYSGMSRTVGAQQVPIGRFRQFLMCSAYMLAVMVGAREPGRKVRHSGKCRATEPADPRPKSICRAHPSLSWPLGRWSLTLEGHPEIPVKEGWPSGLLSLAFVAFV